MGCCMGGLNVLPLLVSEAVALCLCLCLCALAQSHGDGSGSIISHFSPACDIYVLYIRTNMTTLHDHQSCAKALGNYTGCKVHSCDAMGALWFS